MRPKAALFQESELCIQLDCRVIIRKHLELEPDEVQDTYYRLARLDLDRANPAAALANVERGLALGRAADPAADIFVANLFVARGAAHQALGDALAASADYHQALVINEKVVSSGRIPVRSRIVELAREGEAETG